MANGESYKQCVLTQGTSRITAWIPERAAIAGADVEVLDGVPKKDRDFWRVAEVSAFSMSSEALRAKQGLDRKGFLSIERHK